MRMVVCDPLKFVASHLFAWEYTVILKIQGVKYFFFNEVQWEKKWGKFFCIKIKQRLLKWGIKSDVYFKLMEFLPLKIGNWLLVSRYCV